MPWAVCRNTCHILQTCNDVCIRKYTYDPVASRAPTGSYITTAPTVPARPGQARPWPLPLPFPTPSLLPDHAYAASLGQEAGPRQKPAILRASYVYRTEKGLGGKGGHRATPLPFFTPTTASETLTGARTRGGKGLAQVVTAI